MTTGVSVTKIEWREEEVKEFTGQDIRGTVQQTWKSPGVLTELTSERWLFKACSRVAVVLGRSRSCLEAGE